MPKYLMLLLSFLHRTNYHMMKTRFKTILFLLLIFNNSVNAQQWQGHWTSSFGNIKFIERSIKPQNAALVFGNYGKNGTIVGVSIAGKLHGVFYDSKSQKGGELTFTQNKSTDSYTGTWSFDGKQKKLGWNGGKVNIDKPENLQGMDRFRSVEGSWQSNFGLLDFVQNGIFVNAEYSDKGRIFAVYNQANNNIFGLFTNKERFGLLKFSLNSEKNKFDGSWSWETSSWSTQKWIGSRK